MHRALVARPGSCIRRLGATRAREMQFTRFLRNDAVTVGEMATVAAENTARRVAGRHVVAIHDTSELVLGGGKARANGVGPVGKGGALGGLLLHPVLAMDATTGAMIGLVDLRFGTAPAIAHRRGALAPRWTRNLNAGSKGPLVPARSCRRRRRLRSCRTGRATSMSSSPAVRPMSIKLCALARTGGLKPSPRRTRCCFHLSTACRNRAGLR